MKFDQYILFLRKKTVFFLHFDETIEHPHTAGAETAPAEMCSLNLDLVDMMRPDFESWVILSMYTHVCI